MIEIEPFVEWADIVQDQHITDCSNNLKAFFNEFVLISNHVYFNIGDNLQALLSV